MKKNGFIATSLIYSFFLVFVAIIAGLMNNYIANKTILDRYNDQVEEDLNTNTYSIILQVTNGNINDSDAVTLTNLVQNSDFSSNLDFWEISDSTTLIKSNYIGINSLQKKHSNITATASQIIGLSGLNNGISTSYYFSMDIANDTKRENLYYVNIIDGSDAKNIIQYSNNIETGVWKKVYNSFTSDISKTVRLSLGTLSRNYGSANTYTTNLLLINLSASYGYGFEPSKDWMYENVDWFNGTIHFLKKSKIDSKSRTKFEINADNDHEFLDDYVSCYYKNGGGVNPSKILTDGNKKLELTFNFISDDVRCTIKAV